MGADSLIMGAKAMRATLPILLSLLCVPAFAADGTDLGVDTGATGVERAKGDGLPVVAIVHFASGSATLSAKARALLVPVAGQYVADDGPELELAGHTDNSGTERLNGSLSEDRAKAVAKFLVEHGVKATRISVIGYSSFEPVADNKTEAGRARNRRTEIKLTR